MEKEVYICPKCDGELISYRDVYCPHCKNKLRNSDSGRCSKCKVYQGIDKGKYCRFCGGKIIK